MRGAGNLSAEEKMNRIYENMKADYKFFMRLEDHLELIDLTNQGAKKGSSARNLGGKTSRQHSHCIPRHL